MRGAQGRSVMAPLMPLFPGQDTRPFAAKLVDEAGILSQRAVSLSRRWRLESDILIQGAAL